MCSMLRVTVLGSSSKGNSYVIEDDTTKLVFDIGVKKSDRFIDYSKVDGIFTTHLHGDHIQDIRNVNNYYNGKYYGNKSTIDILPILDSQKVVLEEYEKVEVGNFILLPFDLYHDVDNFGYLLRHKPTNMKLLFITDTSSISNLEFKDVDVFIIEANHSWSWLDEKENIEFKDYRTYGDSGHLAVEDTIEFLNYNVNHNTKHIILTHISRSANDYKEIERKVQNHFDNSNINIVGIDPMLVEPMTVELQEVIDIDFD